MFGGSKGIAVALTAAAAAAAAAAARQFWPFAADVQGTATPATPPAAVSTSSVTFADNAPSWQLLEQMAKAKMQELGTNFWADPNDGPTHPLAMKRTFGRPESEIKIKFYRDHAAWCPYCQKVWLQLEEKRIPYTIEKVNMRCYGDKPSSFMAKVPNGLLPVIEYRGQVITESSVIMNLLEDEFPDNKPLMPPAGSPDRPRADMLMRLERQFFSVWLGWLCNGWDDGGRRAQYERTLDVVCSELDASGGPFFLGNDISLVDITWAPMLERAVASLAYYKGYYSRGRGKWPALDRWFDAMEKRSTYVGTKSDFYTHAHDLPPQMGGCAMTATGEPVAAAIDGTDGAHMRLPLPPLNGTSLPEPYSPGESPELDRLEAAAKMIKNHVNVTRFALRGAGKPGSRPVSAPLADPTAAPALQHVDAMDAGLRSVVHALLVGADAQRVSAHAMQVSASASGHPADPVISSAEYMRDRVGVPRDMRFPAARQLRAHLNHLIDQLQQA
ncbi:hypothetical protein FOA52_013163 [Chlamydomonas sp. UWO 241]|nr:hypothetical protein FOA52_013163 [Chlamydomonas sp. UWO 241]